MDDVFDKISRGFREFGGGQSQQVVLVLLILGAALLTGAILALAISRRRRRAPSVPPLSRILFPRLCRENGLTRAQTRLLLRIAETYHTPDPAILFFRRSIFESACTTLGLDAETTEALRRRLYGP